MLASTEIFGAMSPSDSVAIFFAVFSVAGLGLATANYWALSQTLLPQEAGGRIAGVQNTSLNLAGIVAPIVTGWLKEVSGGYTLPMQAIWVVLLAGIGAYLVLIKEPARELVPESGA
jgi:MFS family permease